MKKILYTFLLSALSLIYLNGQELITDGSFEAGAFGGTWTESSLNFGTPICDIIACGTGTGTGPNTGDFWVWFGGIAAYEAGSVSQSFMAPSAGMADLTFQFEAIVCDSPIDYLEVLIDGSQVWIMDGGSGLCGNLGYTLMSPPSIPLTAGVHTIEFRSETFALGGGVTNFFVDDVSLFFTPDQTEPIPTMGEWGIIILGISLVIFSLVAIRRRSISMT